MVVLDWVFADGFGSRQHHRQLVRDLSALREQWVSAAEDGQPLVRSPRRDSDGGHAVGTQEESELPEAWREWLPREDEAAPFESAARDTRSARAVSLRAPGWSPVKDSTGSDKRQRSVEDEATYLCGAGAILLHPFLEQLFRERGLLTDRRFRDNETRDRAVHLIGVLTFGIVDAPEYELLLPKLLCGAAFEEPLPPATLEDDDIATCEALLRAVLEHWKALRSSSPDWLRQQFFLRDGKLQRVESGYRLTVERRVQDVLLARLPWGFGVFAPPWLNERIFVHWMD